MAEGQAVRLGLGAGRKGKEERRVSAKTQRSGTLTGGQRTNRPLEEGGSEASVEPGEPVRLERRVRRRERAAKAILIASSSPHQNFVPYTEVTGKAHFIIVRSGISVKT